MLYLTYGGCMPGFSMNVSQQQRQSLHMKMNPQMLQSLSLLTMNAAELRDYIYEETQRNPALEITRDAQPETVTVSKISARTGERIVSSGGNTAASDDFQAFIESAPQPEESLQEHLTAQYRLQTSDRAELHLAEKIIGNLDSRGFHLAPPESLLDPARPEETPELLNRCIRTIRHLDPVGCAAADVTETLLIQADNAPYVPPLARYLLNGRLDLLEKPRPPLVLKKLQALAETDEIPPPLTEASVTEALDFIKTLDPLPARNYASSATAYVSPDIRVTRLPADEEGAWRFEVELTRSSFPEIALSPVFTELAESPLPKTELEKQGRKFAKEAVRDAQWFISAVEQRESTLLKTGRAIVSAQRAFFEAGPRALAPLRMKDIAEIVGVHETTVSRIANGKYLQCEWGLFEIKYFFSSQVSRAAPVSANAPQLAPLPKASGATQRDAPLSKESVKFELKALIDGYRAAHPSAKPLSDQKLSDLLAERGIRAARRTVAKYRTELNIDSSFDRK